VARLLGVGDFGNPATLFHNPLGPKNGVFAEVVSVDVLGIFNQVNVFNVPPAITVSDMGNVPGGGISSGYGLTQFYYLAHGASITQKSDLPNDRPPRLMKWILHPGNGTAIL
jgi:hypothetical protein